MVQPNLAKVLIEQTPERVDDLEGMGIKFNKINGEFYDFLCCFAKVKISAAVIAKSAFLRKESHGSHHREDYPEKNNKEFKKIIKVSRKNCRNIYKYID